MSDSDAVPPPNPYQPPAEIPSAADLPDLGQPRACLEAVNLSDKQKPCRVLVYPDRLRIQLAPEEDAPDPTSRETHDVLREQLGERTRIVDGWIISRCLECKLGRVVLLQFAAADYDWLTRWMAPVTPEMLRALFRPRFRFALPLGILIALSALPIPGLPFSPLFFGMGIGLVALSVLTRYFPHRVFLLVDAFWFLLLAAAFSYDILWGDKSYWWFLLVLVNAGMAANAVALHRRLGIMQAGLPADQRA